MFTAWIVFSIIFFVIWLGFAMWYLWLTMAEEWRDPYDQRAASIAMLIGLGFVFFHIVYLISAIPALVIYMIVKAVKKPTDA